VSDLARCAVLAARTPHAQEIYNVGSGVGHSLLELVDEVRAVVGRDLEVRMLPPRPFDVPVNVLDCRRAQGKLGWRAEVGFREGLRWTWEVQQAEAQARRRRRS
jgi:UDP-glucose 4-epimerase